MRIRFRNTPKDGGDLRQVLKGKMGNLAEEYEILEEIGRGSYSVCKRCVHRASKVINYPPLARMCSGSCLKI